MIHFSEMFFFGIYIKHYTAELLEYMKIVYFKSTLISIHANFMVYYNAFSNLHSINNGLINYQERQN